MTALPPSGSAPLRREARQFAILSRDAVRRLLNSAVHSRDADPMQFALWVASLAATPPAIYAFRMIFIYAGAGSAPSIEVVEDLAIANRLFFIVYAMIAAALLAALIWEALVPDRSDQEIVGVLPVRPRTAAAARLAAAVSVMVAFALAIAVPSGVLFSLASGSAFGLLSMPAALVAHVVSITLACLMVFLSLLVIRGTLAIIAGPAAATGLATILQIGTIVMLVEVFVYLPSLLPMAVTRILANDPGAAVMPPAWFAGLYSWIAGTDREVLVAGARLALLATLTSAALALLVYLVPAGMLGRRTLETRARERSRGVASLVRAAAPIVLRSPVVRGMFLFAVASFVRSRRHLFILATYVGLGVGVCLISLVAAEVRGTLVISEPRAYLLAIPLVMIFFVVFGLRSACAVPTELEANWPFRLSEPTTSSAVAATSATMLAVGVIPIAVMAIVAAQVAGWSATDTVTVILFDLVSAVFLIECALYRWNKVPFASAHLPSQDTIKTRWPFFIVLLNVFAFRLADVQAGALGSVGASTIYVAAIGGMAALIHLRRAHHSRGVLIQFDEDPESSVQTLGLSEALR